MKFFIVRCTILFFLGLPILGWAQTNSVGINTGRTPNSNAVLELVSPGGNQGFLVPKLSTSQRGGMSLSDSENGLMVYDSDLNQFFFWRSGSWKAGLGVFSETPAGGDLTGNYPNPTIKLQGVTNEKIADDAVSEVKLQDGSVTTAKVADAAITTAKIADLAVTGAKLEDTGVTAGTYGNAFTVVQFTVDAKGRATNITEVAIDITTSNITNGTILNEDISDGTITISKLNAESNTDKILIINSSGQIVWENTSNFLSATLSQNNLYIGNSSGVATGLPVTGDISFTNDGSQITTEINANAVTASEIAANAVTASEIQDEAITSSDIGTGAVATDEILNATIADEDLNKTNIPLSGFAPAAADVDLGNNKITGLADPTADQDAATKKYVDDQANAINTLQDGRIYIGNATDSAIEVSVSGDATLANDGNLTISQGAVEATAIEGLADGEIIIGVDGTAANNTKVTLSGDATLANDGTLDVTNEAIDSTELATDAVISSKIKTGAVTTTEILDETIVAGDIATGAVTTDEILNETIDSLDIRDGTISNADLKNDAVTNAKVLRTSLLPDRILGTQTTNGRGLMVAQQTTTTIDFPPFGPTQFYVPSFLTTNTSSVIVTDANGNIGSDSFNKNAERVFSDF